MAISMLKIRRPLGRLIFNMGIAIPGKTVFLIETAPSVRLQGRVIGLGKAYISLAYFQLDMYDIYQNRKKTEFNDRQVLFIAAISIPREQ